MATNGQFFLFPLWIFQEYSWASMGLPAKAIIPVLFRHANREGECWPSQVTIAAEAGVKARISVRKAASELIGNGLISTHKKHNPRGGPLTAYRREISADYKKFGSQNFTPFHYQIIDSGAWGACTLSAKALYPVLRWRAKLYGDEETESDVGGGWIDEDSLWEHLQTRRWDIVRKASYKSIAQLAEWSGIDRRSMGSAMQSLLNVGLVAEMPEVRGAFKVMLNACGEQGGK